MNQIWINSRGGGLAALTNGVSCCDENKVIVIFPGFYQAKCDSYYFITNFLMRLKQKNTYAISVDLYAHGDSYGDIGDITIDRLKEDLIDIIEHLKQKGFESIYVVGRGLISNILLYNTDMNTKNIFLINPVILDCNERDKISEWIKKQKEDKVCVDGKFIESNSNIIKMFGTETENIRGEFLNKKFWQQLVTLPIFEKKFVNKLDKGRVFITDDWKQYYTADIYTDLEFIEEYKFCDFNERIKLIDYIIGVIDS